jgi:hypothetical protein
LQIAIEIVDLPIDSMVVLHSFLYVYHAVGIIKGKKYDFMGLSGISW